MTDESQTKTVEKKETKWTPCPYCGDVNAHTPNSPYAVCENCGAV
jgi:hypothetical protein